MLCLQAQASKLVADAAAHSEGYNLTGFLREVGLPAASSAPPASARDFALIKREGLKSAAAAVKHGDSSTPHSPPASCCGSQCMQTHGRAL